MEIPQMMKRTLKLWNNVPGFDRESTVMEYYPAQDKRTEAVVVIFPGGAYAFHADHEGKGYAEYLNSIGMDAYVVYYSVAPNRFPLPLLDARRAVRYLRRHYVDLGVDPKRIAVMGSSAGGHLASLVSTYDKPVEGEGLDYVDTFPFKPDATILCYPVIQAPEFGLGHYMSFENLCGDIIPFAEVSTDKLVGDDTPPAFIFHTSTDDGVDVRNSYAYAEALKRHHIPNEVHIFARGGHGGGTFAQDPYVGQWPELLRNWFIQNGWLPKK